MTAPALRFVGVSRTAGPDGPALLDGLDLEVAAGSVLQIVGPSGAGKTTLLRLVNRLDEVSAGTVEVLGRPLRDWPPGELRRRVGMVFQEPSLLGRSARETLSLPLELTGHGSPPGDGGSEPAGSLAAAMALAGVESDWLDRGAAQLSTGQKQRICIARSLVHAPDVLLLDEPTAGLDPRSASRLLERLLALNTERGTTLLLVTHRLDEAPRMGGRLCVLIDGRLAACDDTARLLADPPSGPVRAFLQDGDTHA